MEDEYLQKIENPFAFFNEKDVQANFANLNIELLKGAHIQRNSYYLFQLLIDYEGPIRNFYQSIYSLELVKDKADNEIFFYLDFIDESKGKVSLTSRHRELSEIEIVVGLVLLKMYYERYFEFPKEIKWADFRAEILESENSHLYKALLFDDIREDYSDTEWENARKQLKRALKNFETLGWIDKKAIDESEEIHFVIKESIHRFAKLYQKEIANFDKFVESYKKIKQT